MIMKNHHYGVIMAGGSGSRFWPLSRDAKPKQFLDFAHTGKSFLRQTYDRLCGIVPPENILVVTLTKYHDAVKEHIPELPEANILTEPYSRNTAPCIAYAMYSILKRDPDAVMVISPSDHMITNVQLYVETVSEALQYAAKHDSLITLGVVPDRADPNFGYIQAVGGKGAYEHGGILKVKTFTEKPDAEIASVFVSSGEFLWNTGIFAWSARVIQEEMERFVPQITGLFRGWEDILGTEGELEFLQKAYTDMERLSIDSAVMEKTEKDWVLPAKFGWADIGNWDSLYNYISEHDADGNAGNAEHRLIRHSSNDILFVSDKKKLVAISGLDNYVVIDSDDVLMICPRDDKKLKEITAHIGLPDFESFR